jgi:hypothetical protein
MLEKLFKDFPVPAWADERYKRLAFLDAAIDGQMFNSLKGSFYDASPLEAIGRRARLTARKPSVRYNIARYVARQSARKLFAGRHAPKFVHPKNAKLALAAEALMREGFLKTRILQAAVWGSVGSVAITFTILPGGDKQPRIIFNVQRARDCWPTLDELGELKCLRLAYTVKGVQLVALGMTVDMKNAPLKADEDYWFVRDYCPGREVTYIPPRVGTEIDGVEIDKVIRAVKLTEFKDLAFDAPGDLVAAHWFVNLSGGEFPDGACTWEDALPGMVEISVTLSNVGRGVRYNGTPMLVVIGNKHSRSGGGRLAPGEPPIGRDAADVLHLNAETTEQGAKVTGKGDAKLLEMRGNSVAAALKYVEAVRKYSLELVGASRKDPDRSHWPQSGKAMELLDEDFFDLVNELRTGYGEYGVIPLMKKALTVASALKHPLLAGVDLRDLDELALKWPRPYQPSAQEIQNFAVALSTLVTGKPGKGATAGDGAAATPVPGIITAQEAHEMLDEFMDTPSKTTSVAVQQRPRVDGTEDEPTPGRGDGAGNGVDITQRHPQGRQLPERETPLNPPPYSQQ